MESYFNQELAKYDKFECKEKPFAGSKLCIFHVPLKLSPQDEKVRENRFIQIKNEHISQNKTLFCIGYHLKGLEFSGEIPISINLSHSEIDGKISCKATFKGIVDFSTVSFRGELEFESLCTQTANFSDSVFTQSANFSKATFEKRVKFSSARFEAGANFSNVILKEGANFFATIFGEQIADFSSSIFQKDQTTFLNTKFEAGVNFSKAIFESSVYLYGASFKLKADFYDTSFKDDANFSGTTFHARANMLHVTFQKEANFESAQFKAAPDFTDTVFGGRLVNFSKTTFEGQKPDSEFTYAILQATFRNTNFKGLAYFSETKFKYGADFTGAIFEKAAIFYNCSFKDVATFSETRFESITKFDKTVFSSEVWCIKSLFKAEVNFNATFEDMTFFSFSRFEDAVFFSSKFNDVTIFHFVLFEAQEKVVFTTEKLSKVSFLNCDITRVKFSELARWGEENEDRFKVIEERWLESVVKEKKQPLEPHPYLSTLVISVGAVKTVYRNLRENYEFRLRYDEAGKFFIREMDLRRNYKEVLVMNSWWIQNIFSLTAWYYHLSRYGEDILRPTLAGIIIVMLSTIFFVTQSNPVVESNFFNDNENTTNISTFIGISQAGNYSHWLLSVKRSIADFIPVLSLGGEIQVGIIDYVIKIVGGVITFGLIAIALRRRFERKYTR